MSIALPGPPHTNGLSLCAKTTALCTPAHGSRTLGGPCIRWNDIIPTDLRRLDAKDNWCQKTQDQSEWHRKWRVLNRPSTVNARPKRRRPRMRASGGGKSDQLKRQMHLCILRKAAPSWPEIHPALQTTVVSGNLSCEV